MERPVEFVSAHTPTSQSGYGIEWAVAWEEPDGSWTRGDVVSEDDARRAAESNPGQIVISREVLGWKESPAYEIQPAYDGNMDELVAEIILEENDIVRAGLARGADVAVTHMESPGSRVAHRISCLSLEGQFDRSRVWTTYFRERLQEDRNFRPALPSLFTPDEARAITGLRSCKICWPNIGGTDLPPTRKLYAAGLKGHHIGRVIADENGLEIGTVKEVVITRSSAPGDRFGTEAVTVVTDTKTLQLDPRTRMQIRSTVETPEAAAREAAIRSRVGL